MRNDALISRLNRLEKKLKEIEAQAGPVDLYNCYYDELEDLDRWRWWNYVYHGRCPFGTLASCEAYELRNIRDTLHFKCDRIRTIDDIIDLPELTDLEIKISRRDFMEV